MKQGTRSLDDGETIATALFAGADGDGTPVRCLGCGLRSVEPHHAARAQDGNDARDAEFGRLLHDPIHPVAARYALHQRGGERRLAVDLTPVSHRRRDPGSAHTLDRGGKFATIAGEQDDAIAAAQAQHLGEMGGGNGRQLDDVAGSEFGVDVDPR